MKTIEEVIANHAANRNSDEEYPTNDGSMTFIYVYSEGQFHRPKTIFDSCPFSMS